jgi:hypothetical protein
MKLIDAIHRVDRSKDNETDALGEALFNDLGLSSYESNLDLAAQSLKAYWLVYWYCTDTHVGYQAIYLNDEPVAVSIQQARKNDKEIFWLSSNARQKTYDFLITCVINVETDNSTYINSETEIDDIYTVQWTGQLLDDAGTIGGRAVKVDRQATYKLSGSRQILFDKIVVVYEDTQEVATVGVKDLEIPIKVV